jgi:CRISPR system Cascade subunit CasA
MSAICDLDVVDFALPRADFQGAAYQFAIGLLQTVFAPKDKYQWHGYYSNAPSTDRLQAAFNTVAHAFNVVGDGPLFMQDWDSLDDAASTTVSGLLIEAPGANGIKHNTDHFVKRGIGEVMSLDMACIALFTLQINAPSGGSGHRVGLRGGGPLTTLVLPQEMETTLWQKLWLNVINQDEWRESRVEESDLHSAQVFPWLEPTRISSKKGSEIYENDVHPLHMYWAMPRRIRLEVQGKAECRLTGKVAEATVACYRTLNYGANYSGDWSHPLTPYKWDPKKPNSEHLSIKGQQGGLTYKIWDLLTLASEKNGQKCAKVVSHFYSIVNDFTKLQREMPRIWVFGYDMDNMKARGWYSESLPLFSLPAEQQDDLVTEVKCLQDLASNALWHCRSQIKAAWFEKPKEAKGDMSFIDLAFWHRTEAAFFIAVRQLSEQLACDHYQLQSQQAEQWLKSISTVAVDVFDEYALAELGSERSMAKRIKARRSLTGWLYAGKDIKTFRKEHNIELMQEKG